MCWNSSCLSIICYSFYNTLIFSFFLSSHLSRVHLHCKILSNHAALFKSVPCFSFQRCLFDNFPLLSFSIFFPSSQLSFSIFSITLPLTYSLLSRTQASQRRGEKSYEYNESLFSFHLLLSFLPPPPSLPPSCSQRCLRCWFPLCLSGLSSAGQQQLRVTKFKCMNKKINRNNSMDTDTQCGWQSVWPSVSLTHWHSCFLNLKTLCESVCVCAGVLLKLDQYTD